METRASHLLVGGFMLVLLAGIVTFIMWLAKVQLDQEVAHYLIYFRGSVTGLQEGNPVRYRGIPVGSVTAIRINPENVEEVEVTIEVPREAPIKEDAEASLEIQGITGLAYVLISGGTQDSPPLRASEGERHPVIASRPSQLEKVIESAPELLNRFIVLVDRATLLLSDQNQEAIAETLDNVRTLTGSFAARSGEVEALLKDASAAVARLKDAARSLDLLTADLRGQVGHLTDSADATLGTVRQSLTTVDVEAKRVGGELAPALAEIQEAARAIHELTENLNTMIAENRQPFREFSSSGLYELTQLLTETRILVAALTRVTAKIESDPARFLFGDVQAGYEAE